MRLWREELAEAAAGQRQRGSGGGTAHGIGTGAGVVAMALAPRAATSTAGSASLEETAAGTRILHHACSCTTLLLPSTPWILLLLVTHSLER